MHDMFAIQGNSVKLVATTTAAPGTLCSTGDVQGMQLSNASTVPIYVALGASSTVQAAAPTSAAPAKGMCILPDRFHNIYVPPDNYISAITTASTGANLWGTPGRFI